MKITKETTENLTATICMEVTPDDYTENVSKALKDLQRKANIPGFRPGKVPAGMIRKMYGKAVTAEEVNKLISGKLSKYLEEENLNTLGHPLGNPDKNKTIDFDLQDSFSFFFDIGLSPEVKVELDQNVEIPYYAIEVDDKTLENYIAEQRQRHGKYADGESVVANDMIHYEISEFENGNPKEGGIHHQSYFSTEKVQDKEQLNQLLGQMKGSKLMVDPAKLFTDPADRTRYLGVKAERMESIGNEFELTVLDILHVEPAEMNEAFFETVFPGSNILTAEDFRLKVKAQLESSFRIEAEQAFLSACQKDTVKRANLPLPDEFLKRWLLESNEDKFSQEQVDAQYPLYADSLRWQIIENHLLKANEIKIDEDDVKEYVRGWMRNRFNVPVQDQVQDHDQVHEHHPPDIELIVDRVMEDKEQVKKIYDELYDKRLIQLFKDKITLKEEQLGYEAFVKKMAQ
ncbi:MAG: trigger factor [Bacteroidetes bacterium]|nr:trigger factor [Bacteroidota bacterium]